MRRKEREVTDKKAIEDIIRKATICRLGLSLNNKPYIVPMNFGYKNNELYFHCAKRGMKTDIILENNQVCFEIETDTELVKGEHACIDWKMHYQSVIGFGKACMLETADEKTKGLNIIMEHYTGKTETAFTVKNIRSVSIIKVEIESMTGKRSLGEEES